MEDALSHEVKHRREMEGVLTSTEKEKKNLAIEYQTKTEQLVSAQKEIEKKSNAVEEQMTVARQLARQLHTTKQKIFALKQHLQAEGLLKDSGIPLIPHHSPLVRSAMRNGQNSAPEINATASNDSINWSVSEDEESA